MSEEIAAVEIVENDAFFVPFTMAQADALFALLLDVEGLANALADRGLAGNLNLRKMVKMARSSRRHILTAQEQAVESRMDVAAMDCAEDPIGYEMRTLLASGVAAQRQVQEAA